ncbi:MAG: helix-turn-helix transcriptional regulator [Alphaproteobacteria bacterium]|nr:helix-turn-helix transcriptional regulator [Alphaproteobacteria bacterium]
MITGKQIRAARMLLDWDAEDLADKTGLNRETVFNIERGTVQARAGTIEKIVRTFRDGGIEFIPDEGVKRRSDSVTKLEGFRDFKFFMDQMYEAATEPYSYDGTKPICICNLDNSLFRKYMKDYHAVHVERLKKLEGLKIRSLAAEVDKNHVKGASYLEYRYLKELKAVIAPFYVFGDNFSIIDFDVQDPPKILMIHSPALAHSYRDQFDIMWKNASEAPPA